MFNSSKDVFSLCHKQDKKNLLLQSIYFLYSLIARFFTLWEFYILVLKNLLAGFPADSWNEIPW